MESAREKDGTLDEIHAVLKKRYHWRLTWLATVTGAAMILSLLVLFINKWNFPPYKELLMVLVSALDFAAIVLGLMFVVSIVDPAKHESAAAGALEDIRRQLRVSGAKASPAMFFEAFTILERVIRDYLDKENLSPSDTSRFRNALSFPQMIEILFNRNKIDHPFFDELRHLNAYRNIVFHGHVKQADQSMIEKTVAAAEKIGKLV